MDAVDDFLPARLELFIESVPPPKDSMPFFTEIIQGVCQYRSDIDATITSHATNWKLERMLDVDRNLLRLATYELLYCDDIPGQVTINEAVEIAKLFGGEDSPRFINGILNRIYASSAT